MAATSALQTKLGAFVLHAASSCSSSSPLSHHKLGLNCLRSSSSNGKHCFVQNSDKSSKLQPTHRSILHPMTDIREVRLSPGVKSNGVVVNAASDGAMELERMKEVGVGKPMSAPNKRILSFINESTKWAVSAAAAGFLLWKHDERTAWCILGSIGNTITGKILKRLIKQSRPPTSRKADPGMPSSHATSLAYFGTYISLAILLWQGPRPTAVTAAFCTQALTAFLAWLRTALGYHSPAQVLVGCAVGNVVAICWLAAGEYRLFPAIAAPDGALLRVALFLSTAVIVLAFVVYALRRWTRELPFFSRTSEHKSS